MFLLSADQAFEPTGRKTKIPYSAQYHQRKRLLEESANEPATQALFKHWDEFVFAGVPPHVHNTEDPENPLSDIDEQEEARRALARNDFVAPDAETFNWDEDLESEPGAILGEVVIQPNIIPSSVSSMVRGTQVPQVPQPPVLSLAESITHESTPTSALSARPVTTRRPTRSPSVTVAFAPTLSASEAMAPEVPGSDGPSGVARNLADMEIVDHDVCAELPNSARGGRGRGRGARARGAPRGRAVVTDSAPRATRSRK